MVARPVAGEAGGGVQRLRGVMTYAAEPALQAVGVRRYGEHARGPGQPRRPGVDGEPASSCRLAPMLGLFPWLMS
jgi:hypothetical protein